MGYLTALRWQCDDQIQQKAFDLRHAITIGRNPENGIGLTDNRASRKHAQLVWSDGALQLTNLSQTNPIWIISQGHRMTLLHEQTAILKLTDTFLIGGTLFEVLEEDDEVRIICPDCGRILPARLLDCPFDGATLANGRPYKG